MTLEICIDRIESGLAAVAGGANRLEVCSALEIGGLTPSSGLLAECCELPDVSVMAMIRPRGGDFCYSNREAEVMVRDIVAAREIGVDGIVIGALTSALAVDRGVCQRLLDAAGPVDVTFHRAFDLVADPFEALDELQGLGIRRLLTSGQRATAIEGIDLIRQLVDRSGDLAVMAGAGVDSEIVPELLQVGVREIHSSASSEESVTPSAFAADFGGRQRVTCREKVRKLRVALDS
ncbi:MAG: copper homeostasis protein [Pirellulaceae bacterium]|jgi:copper homeostasis protein